ncbi:hypothetical protein [Aquimarina algiphila]|uniref:hypothetical protein n=1 Tax=Aquimarina algiphila TaxID=2047982 RepID=UPI002492E1E8|nr:hypothetical protein [Aquimarina algiphila]
MKLEEIKKQIEEILKSKLNHLKVSLDDNLETGDFVISVWWNDSEIELPGNYEHNESFMGNKKDILNIYNNEILPFIKSK